LPFASTSVSVLLGKRDKGPECLKVFIKRRKKSLLHATAQHCDEPKLKTKQRKEMKLRTVDLTFVYEL
jgi:hypothetical protein